jgi:DNA-binding transcriptional LysR family regulator
MLHSRLLRYLDEVARRGSIRQAGAKLNVSASSINRQILQLEEEFGTPLFVRLNKRLRLTAAGELVTQHIRDTLKEYGQLEGRLEQLRGIKSGTVRVVAMHGIAGGILTPIVASFRRKQPNVLVEVKAAVVEGVVRSLLMGEADLGLAYRLPPNPALVVTAHYRTEIGAVVAPSHPLARQAIVRLVDCIKYPIIVADETLTIHQLMTNAFLRAGIEFQPDYRSNSVELMKAMARTQQSVTFLSRIDVTEDLREGTLVFIPFPDSHYTTNQLALVRRRKVPLSGAAALLEEQILTALGEPAPNQAGVPVPASNIAGPHRDSA